MVISSSPFGGQTRTRTLVLLQLLGRSYPREIARTLGTALAGVQSALRGLERDGLVVASAFGRTRLYELNPRYFAIRELRPYLTRLAEGMPDVAAGASSLRRRPRSQGKPL